MNHKLVIVAVIAAFLTIANAQTFAGGVCPNTVKGGGSCSSDNDCGGSAQGSCLGGFCNCTNLFWNANCNYKGMDSYNAGLFGLFLLIGVGGTTALSIGNLSWGIPQLLLTILPGVVGCIIARCGPKGAGGPVAGALNSVAGAFWVWSLATTIIYGARTLDYSRCDGNGYPLFNNVPNAPF